jgi:PAB-dependent poly(A)-specific ribonuclease subunit 3
MRERILATSRDPNSLVPVPELVQHKYHSLLLLDTVEPSDATLTRPSRVLGYKTCAYKALSTVDPFVYCLRRVDGFRLSNFDLVQEAIEKWSEIKHPNIVAVRQAFATSEFQDLEGQGEGGSLVYVYDYIDLAQTLEHWYESSGTKPVHEAALWDVITQVALALRVTHSRKLAARCVDPSKILVSSRFRIHLNCLGLLDAIQHQLLWNDVDSGQTGSQSLIELQKRDLHALARIVITLGSGRKWEQVMSVNSQDLINEIKRNASLPESVLRVVEELFSPEGTADSVIALSGAFVAFKAEQLESTQDVLVSELRKFVDQSRMHKLLVKISAISDRAHLLEDWRWASTGDRYIVQLFRDYVFYQNDETGRPFFDFGHVSDCLAKVDVGSFEPIMLMNRDGSSVIVTTYNDIRRCIETSFKEIADASVVRPPHPRQNIM